ncbi:MAG: transpeptidase family protein [Deltaproteobacteria bacterium]|nr:transpeptidase family protein [Deltaproteobacteria bacterium]
MRSADLRHSGRRTLGVGVGLLLFFGVLAVRAAHLSVIDGRGLERGERQTLTVLRVAPARGTITDRHGSELAITVQAPSVYAVPAQITDKQATARKLAKALGKSTATVLARLEKRSPFVYVDRWLGASEAATVRALELSGVGLVDEPRRAYPHKALAGRLVGFANIDGRGARGIEQMEDGWLAGRARTVVVERDARQHLLPKAGVDPRSSVGGDVALTLDATLQAEAETALYEVVRQTGSRGGFVVVLDPQTGDLLALAEAPGFDPGAFRTTPYPQTASWAFLNAPEPGSTLKPFVIATALQRGAVRTDELFDCEQGRWKVPGKVIHDVKGHGLLDPAGILRVSSNIGAAKVGFRVGAQPHYEMLRALGFGSRSGSGFPDESAGLLRSWKSWRTVDHANVSFGQGLNVTVIQMAGAMATLASGGVFHEPRLIAARRQPGGSWETAPEAKSRRVLRPEIARTVMDMMHGVVADKGGTGRRAALEGVAVAGKTGTAQKLDLVAKTYSHKDYQAWFIGAAPLEAPMIAVAVMLDEPRGKIHGGGSIAAPLFARVASAALAQRGVVALPKLGLPDLARVDLPKNPSAKKTATRVSRPSSRPDVAAAKAKPRSDRKSAKTNASESRSQAAKPRRVAMRPTAPMPLAQLGGRVLLPDFRGLSRGEVQTMAAGVSLRLVLDGRGQAVTQHPAPGTIVAGTSAVRVHFEQGI